MLIGTFNKEKVLFGAFSGHCETSRRFVDSSTGQCAAQHTAVPVQAAGTRSRGRARCRNNVNTSAVILKGREVLYCIYRFKIYIRIFIPVHSSGPDIETSARQPVSQNVSCPVQLLYDSSFSSFHSLWVGTLLLLARARTVTHHQQQSLIVFVRIRISASKKSIRRFVITEKMLNRR